MPRVKIGKSVITGEGTGFIVEGDYKELIIEENVYTRKFCNFLLYPSGSLIIRKNVFLNNYCSINCLHSIEIGENTLFGESVKIYDHNHRYHFENNSLIVDRANFSTGKVVIGKNCWIGSNVTILKGVEIGDNVIIGANCLIHKSIPSNKIVKQAAELIIS